MNTHMASVLLLSIIMFQGCQNAGRNAENLKALNDSFSPTGLTGDAAKLVKTATINFKVSYVAKSVREVSNLAQGLGGMTYHQSM